MVKLLVPQVWWQKLWKHLPVYAGSGKAFGPSGVVTKLLRASSDMQWTGCGPHNFFKKKSNSHLPKKLCYLIESPLKTMKNAFYFILKALLVLKISKLLSQLFGYVAKTAWLERLG